ncbi:MAG: hypothetical protein LC753_09565, partial [Acidobacteria bacterium]|nr:hypothetical protein [Acidobacteriota bacterium]
AFDPSGSLSPGDLGGSCESRDDIRRTPALGIAAFPPDRHLRFHRPGDRDSNRFFAVLKRKNAIIGYPYDERIPVKPGRRDA